MSGGDGLPSLTALQRMLRAITERLAQDCVCQSPGAPDWDGLHWQVAQVVAAMHGISPLLSGTAAAETPAAWRDFLLRQREHTLLRHQRIVALQTRIDRLARESHLAAVALKGAALHALELYAPGERPMADLDLLVRPADETAAMTLIDSLGFRELYNSRRERTFAPAETASFHPFGEHRDNPIKIELHTHVAEDLPLRQVDISESLLPAVGAAGLRPYASLAALMSHLLLHAAGGMRQFGVRCIQLNDIARLAPRLDAGQWRAVLCDARGAPGWWVYPPLALVARYYASAIPAQVLAQAASACPAMLRRVAERRTLSDVSQSRLRMTFFMGFEWCRTPAEAAAFVRERVFPGAETRKEVAARVPHLAWAAGSPWYRLSRPRRALRWLFTRPARVATLHSLQAIAKPVASAAEGDGNPTRTC
ncbi:MAG TPA: nucleotidyltransferase family protein [Steroidobacteraceae bacterium]|jgi:hypothetical protein